MARDGTATRTALMDAAEKLILETGFQAASVDRIIEGAGVTKGTFFYHFDGKADLARALVDRFAEADLGHLEDAMARAEKLTRDPVQQLLVFVGLFQEQAETLTEPYPGCLFGSYCYEAGLFDEATHEIIRSTMRIWRDRLGARLRAAIAARPPRHDVDPDSLADMMTVVFEGAFILSKTLKQADVLAAQVGHYRNYLELLFEERPGG